MNFAVRRKYKIARAPAPRAARPPHLTHSDRAIVVLLLTPKESTPQ
jgi:hypothetical protein